MSSPSAYPDFIPTDDNGRFKCPHSCCNCACFKHRSTWAQHVSSFVLHMNCPEDCSFHAWQTKYKVVIQKSGVYWTVPPLSSPTQIPPASPVSTENLNQVVLDFFQPCEFDEPPLPTNTYFGQVHTILIQLRAKCEAFVESKEGQLLHDSFWVSLKYCHATNAVQPLVHTTFEGLLSNYTITDQYYQDTVKYLRGKPVYKIS